MAIPNNNNSSNNDQADDNGQQAGNQGVAPPPEHPTEDEVVTNPSQQDDAQHPAEQEANATSAPRGRTIIIRPGRTESVTQQHRELTTSPKESKAPLQGKSKTSKPHARPETGPLSKTGIEVAGPSPARPRPRQTSPPATAPAASQPSGMAVYASLEEALAAQSVPPPPSTDTTAASTTSSTTKRGAHSNRPTQKTGTGGRAQRRQGSRGAAGAASTGKSAQQPPKSVAQEGRAGRLAQNQPADPRMEQQQQTKTQGKAGKTETTKDVAAVVRGKTQKISETPPIKKVQSVKALDTAVPVKLPARPRPDKKPPIAPLKKKVSEETTTRQAPAKRARKTSPKPAGAKSR